MTDRLFASAAQPGALTRKTEMLRLTARVGYTPPETSQHR